MECRKSLNGTFWRLQNTDFLTDAYKCHEKTKKTKKNLVGIKNSHTFAFPFRQAGASSLIILKDKYKQVPRNNKIESVNSFKELGCQGRAKQYKRYTKKSLILAQDER